jgi:hypothetical protein
MDYLYDNHFKPFYESSIEDLKTKCEKQIDDVLEQVDHIDNHAFWTNLLWKTLNFDVKASTRFPLPPCAR